MATPDVLKTATSTMSEDITICSLCQETFKSPKVLACLHTFCYVCLNEYIAKAIGPSRHNHFSCPSCDMDIEVPALASEGHYADNLKDDNFVTNLVEVKNALKEGKPCDICVRREESVVASFWCSDCNDALCDSCQQAHLHVKVTANHSMVELEEMRKLPLEVMLRKRNKVSCDSHGENITLFCVDCKDAICVQCMAVSHRRCENVVTVSDAVSNHGDVDNVMARLSAMQMPIDNENGMDKLESCLEQSIENTRHEIMYLSNSLCSKIRDQEQFLLKKLDNKAAEAKQILKERTEPRKLHAKSVKSANQRMNNLKKYGSDVEILMAFNQIRKKLDDYDRLVGEVNPDKLKVRLELLPDEPSLSYLDELNSLGEIKIDTGADDGISSWGVTCTSCDDIIVTDCKNKRIQKFSKGGELVDHIQLDDEPRDITTCGMSDDVAVPIIGRLIIFIATRKSLSLLRRTRTERQYDGISYSFTESYLIASSVRERCVDLVQLNGDVLRTFQLDRHGEYLFEQPRYIAAASDRGIVISDTGLHAVKCIDQYGNSVFSYSGNSELKCPQGVCLDKVGNIFVADNSNDRIQLLTSHGAFQRFVLDKDTGLERPCAIKVSGSNRLVIVQNDGMVKVYSYA